MTLEWKMKTTQKITTPIMNKPMPLHLQELVEEQELELKLEELQEWSDLLD